jgi:thiamine biosynthesis protein ThiI
LSVASRHAVVHYAEIGLKGRNRAFFERALMHNISQRMRPLGLEWVERLPGRLLIHLQEPLDEPAWAEALGVVFGIAYFAPVYMVSREMAAIRSAILEHLPPGSVSSFRLRASRGDKSFPLTSPEIERALGAAVQEKTGWPVRLKGADLTIHIEVLYDRALVYFQRLPGPGGLPVGVSGRVGLLLSGGIDSPVAGYLMLKRGCQVTPIHFHSKPFGDWRGAEDRAREIVQALYPYGMEPYLYVVPIGELQREITLTGPSLYRVLLYRRLMVRIAAALTDQEGGQALVTGESLGQVASQTLESLVAIEQAVTMPILRPLIGMDKQEIVEKAQAIGTYELALLEGQDCCQFLMPRRVATRPSLEEVLEAEAQVAMDRLVQEGLAQARRIPMGEAASVKWAIPSVASVNLSALSD